MLYADALIVTGFNVSRFIMDDPNITMEEDIRLEEEKAQRQGQTFDWQTARYGKTKYYENKDDSFTNLETEYPTIVFDNISDATFSREPTVSPPDNNKINFNISFYKFDDEDYMIVFDENSFSCKIISVDNLKTDSENENDNDKINIPSSPSSKPTIDYFDDLDFFEGFENEFPAIIYNDLKSKSDPLNEPSAKTLITRYGTLTSSLPETPVAQIPKDLDHRMDYSEFLYWLASKFDNYWELDKNIKSELWEYHVNGRTKGTTDNLVNYNKLCDESNKKTCSDLFFKPYLDAQDGKDIYEIIDRDYSPIPIPAHHDISNPDELCQTKEFTVVRYSEPYGVS
nr:hypothetical protein [Tanacetum cinerariifolium]